ncbi:Ail/Lom family outer membrane beta-barrel protein [Escherichia coli]|nr:Ail/Lom family outer membrane beta-barrel protein [Escherichia coli]
MGKGGGKAHTPVEAKDNLKSTQMMSVIDAIGEGPIEGPVKGLQSILVNKTPLTDTDGNPVIHGVTAVWRAGEQEQTPPEGFESSGAETALGVEVTKAKPVTRTITSANIDRLRVTFGVQSLVQTTSKGDRNPTSVRLLIQLQRNGNWVTEKDVTINGKTTSQFLASVILDNLPPRPFNIRMVRETADSTSDQLQNKTLWSSYTEIIDVKQCYLHVSTNVPGSDELNGINVKYRYEFTDTLGMVTSFSYAGDKNRQLTHYSDTRWHEDSVRNRWFSVMAGPSVRVNEWFSAYAMAGVAYSRVSTFSGDYLRVTDNKGKTHDVLTGSDDGRYSNTSLAWGAGVQFNPTESVAIDIAYEGSGSGDWRTDGFIVGVGYKF